MWRPRRFVMCVKNLVRWFPVIWNDRDWDHSYFYKILETKLTHMADHFEKSAWGASAEEDAKNMRKCVQLIKDLEDDCAISWNDEEVRTEKKKILFGLIERNIDSWWD